MRWVLFCVALSGCATANWKHEASQGLVYAESVANAATAAAEMICRPALDHCVAAKIPNPCPALESCIENTDKSRKAIATYVRTITLAWLALDAAEHYDEGMRIIMDAIKAAGELRAILATWNVEFPSP